MAEIPVFGSRARRLTKIVRGWIPTGTDPVLAELAVTAAAMVDGAVATQDPRLALQATKELERLRGLIMSASTGEKGVDEGDGNSDRNDGGMAEWVGAGPEVRDTENPV